MRQQPEAYYSRLTSMAEAPGVRTQGAAGSIPVGRAMLEAQLICIVNGEDVAVTTSLLAPLGAVRDQALVQSHNTGRALPDWEIRDERGALIDATKTVNILGLENNERLFLTLPVGLGGALAA